MEVDKPEWLRGLAVAMLLRALRDLKKESAREEIIAWLAGGGRLGDSHWTVCDVLRIPSVELVCVARKLCRGAGAIEAGQGLLWRKLFRGAVGAYS